MEQPQNSLGEIDPYEKSFSVLKNNSFGILEEDGTIEEKIIRLLNLLPMAFQVMDEARETIARLRDENEYLKSGKLEVRKKEISELPVGND